MKVKLTYFYPENGLQRGESQEWNSEFEPGEDEFERCVAHEIKKARSKGQLPGLPKGHSMVIVLIDYRLPGNDLRILPVPSDGGSVSMGHGAVGNFINTGGIQGDFYAGDKNKK